MDGYIGDGYNSGGYNDNDGGYANEDGGYNNGEPTRVSYRRKIPIP
jgi:hypothetical protein